MPNYVQTAYALNNPNGTVQTCLQTKVRLATPNSPDKVNGIAYASCFSAIEILVNGNPKMILGNSRNRVVYKPQGVACVHGECNAFWDAMNEADPNMPTVIEMYVEIEPCENCKAFLNNALGPNQTVYYSFPYTRAGLEDWNIAAHNLCQLVNIP